MLKLCITCTVALLALCEPLRSEPVDLELVLLADSSGSIDLAEIRLQRQGYADALQHSDVQNAIGDGVHAKIAVTYVEWAGADAQQVVVPWTIISNVAEAEAFGTALLAAPREAFGRNAIGSALTRATQLVAENDHEGLRKVIDFSGDSANSWDPVPIETARASAIAMGITINGLAILCRDCNGRPAGYDLEAAFRDTIIGGPSAFVITADGPESFKAAVRRKLVLEIAGRAAILQPVAQAATP